MPFTFMSASSVANGPCCVRYSIIRSAIAGPILGSASSWAAVAVLMFTSTPVPTIAAGTPTTELLASAVGLLVVAAVPGATATTTAVAAPTNALAMLVGGARSAICSCAPSASRPAKFISSSAAPRSAPPAACSASCTIAPGASAYTPGRCTAPLTCTRHACAVAVGCGCGLGAIVGGGISTTGVPRSARFTTKITAAASRPISRPNKYGRHAAHILAL